MAIFTSKEFHNLDDLLLDQLKDLYDVETRLEEALPKMEDAASSSNLKQAFHEHLEQTKRQRTRLEEAFRSLGKDPERETCEAMKGLLKEGEDVIDAKGDREVKDAALVASAQRVEHYEMAGYGTARSLAQRLNHRQVADLLQQTLDEEGNTDKKLTDLATSQINPQAAR